VADAKPEEPGQFDEPEQFDEIEPSEDDAGQSQAKVAPGCESETVQGLCHEEEHAQEARREVGQREQEEDDAEEVREPKQAGRDLEQQQRLDVVGRQLVRLLVDGHGRLVDVVGFGLQ